MDLHKVLSYVRRACEDYDLIHEGDRIAVGVSGGKDSLLLLIALAAMRRFYPKHYDLAAVTVDLGFQPPMDFSPIEALCREWEVPFHVLKTDIYNVIFNIRKEKNPCALCSKMRRAVLHTGARDLGYPVIALGHHFDDAVDTFMLNLFYEGRIGCFQPQSYLSRTGVRIIRPLLYMPEKDIIYFANREHLPVVKSKCPADGNTERTEMNRFINELERKMPGLRTRMFGALQRANVDGFGPVIPGRHSSKRVDAKEPPETDET